MREKPLKEDTLYLGTSVPVVRVPAGKKVLYPHALSIGTTTIDASIGTYLAGSALKEFRYQYTPDPGTIRTYPIHLVHVLVTGSPLDCRMEGTRTTTWHKKRVLVRNCR